MIENSDVSKEICANQLLSIPFDGQWMWDEKTKELVYQSRKKPMKENILKTNENLKIDIRTGLIYYRKQSRPFQQLIKTKDDQTISLFDVIQASLNVMSEIFYVPIEFEEYLRMAPVQEFLLYLLNYFYWFFETMNNAVPEHGKHIDRSEAEKARIRLSYAHLLASLHELASKYTVLLLGINLKNYHHMHNGDLFYSCDNIDRTIYESLFIFSTYFVWITFYRQNFEPIRLELARLFRAGGDIDVLKIPSVQKLEDERPNFSHRYKLADCTDLFTESFAKKAVSSQMNNSKTMSMNEENDIRSTYEFNERSPYYYQKHQLSVPQRRNRIREILTKQLRNRNQSLVEERYNKSKDHGDIKVNKQQIELKTQEREKHKRERQIIQRLLNSSFHKNMSILPIPINPLDDLKSRLKQKEISLPEIQFKLKHNLGIIGQSSSAFDPIRLILKPVVNKDKIIPNEFLVNFSEFTSIKN